MSVRTFLDGRVALHAGDCVTVLAGLPEASVDSVVCDPPYHLTTGKRGGVGMASLNENSPAGRSRIGTGFMGKVWDGGDIAFQPSTWDAVLRVLKPGGHLIAFSGTRTYHRMVCAIEDAGFEIRDQIGWAYGSGFPKSHDVSKGIDKRPGVHRHAEFAAELKAARIAKGITNTFDVSEIVTGRRTGAVANWEKYQWPEAKWWPALRDHLAMDGKWDAIIAQAERERLGLSANKSGIGNATNGHHTVGGTIAAHVELTAPTTDSAKQWEGWGTALKPAWEPIVLARKPLDGTVAANVLRHGTGAINVDGCRVETNEAWSTSGALTGGDSVHDYGNGLNNAGRSGAHSFGRWPANLVLSVPEDEYQLRRFVTQAQKRELHRWLSENA